METTKNKITTNEKTRTVTDLAEAIIATRTKKIMHNKAEKQAEIDKELAIVLESFEETFYDVLRLFKEEGIDYEAKMVRRKSYEFSHDEKAIFFSKGKHGYPLYYTVDNERRDETGYGARWMLKDGGSWGNWPIGDIAVGIYNAIILPSQNQEAEDPAPDCNTPKPRYNELLIHYNDGETNRYGTDDSNILSIRRRFGAFIVRQKNGEVKRIKASQYTYRKNVEPYNFED